MLPLPALDAASSCCVLLALIPGGDRGRTGASFRGRSPATAAELGKGALGTVRKVSRNHETALSDRRGWRAIAVGHVLIAQERSSFLEYEECPAKKPKSSHRHPLRPMNG
jgi:hypothetical protein